MADLSGLFLIRSINIEGENLLIIRVFRVKVKVGRLDESRSQVKTHSIPWMGSQAGCVAFWPGELTTDQSREFTMVSLWDGLDSLRQAVGHDWKQAVLFGDEADLVEQVAVDHYETFGI